MKKEDYELEIMKMYEFMLLYQKENGFSPTYREITKELGISSTCMVEARMKRLIKIGLVKTKGNQFRAVTL